MQPLLPSMWALTHTSTPIDFNRTLCVGKSSSVIAVQSNPKSSYISNGDEKTCHSVALALLEEEAAYSALVTHLAASQLSLKEGT